MPAKGQISAEYLAILAMVLVVTLVAVYLVGGFSNTGADPREIQSKKYWESAEPFSITEWKAAGTRLDLQMKNNDQERLTITNITFGGVSVYSSSGAFNSSESKVINATLPGTCGAAGAPFSYDAVVITYTKGPLFGNKQAGARPIAGRCS